MTEIATLVGCPAPSFTLQCASADEPPRKASLQDYRGRWLALVFYPRDFSFVCPTELTAFSARIGEFDQRNCDLLGVSVDSIERHEQWLRTPIADGGLGPLRFPLGADTMGKAARSYGAWNAVKQVSLRGLFLIDPAGVVQYAVVHNLGVGRSVDEVVRVLDALRTGGLCPVSWTRADGTIDVEQALAPGRVIGHYRIQKKLGAGTFGAVFAAHDERLARDVAIKVLKKNALESMHALTAEARAAAKLQHPNICTLYAIEQEDGLPLIAMERVEGRNLADMIEADDVSQQRDRVAVGIAAGLEAAHAQNVTHGDLKPANILVLEDGTPKILDFGLARTSQRVTVNEAVVPSLIEQSEEPADLAATVDLAETREAATRLGGLASTFEEGGLQGTPLYMSPEQIEGHGITSASDVFSFGLLLYELQTGRRALPDQSLDEISKRLQSPGLAEELSAGLVEPYRSLLTLMLAKEPQSRPAMQAVVGLLASP